MIKEQHLEAFKIDKGWYSTEKNVDELELISERYPKGIFTMDCAFYFHDLSDVIPDKWQLATARTATRITNPRIEQYYENATYFGVGKEIKNIQNVDIAVYDKERMLIELVRREKKLGYDYYKEIIGNYRKHVDDLDMYKLEDYLDLLGQKRNYYERIAREIF